MNLLALLKHKPENHLLLKELSGFVRYRSQAKELNESWVSQVWDFFDNFYIPDLVLDNLRPLWSRLLLANNLYLQQCFLRRFQQFIEVKKLNGSAKKMYQSFSDELLC